MPNLTDPFAAPISKQRPLLGVTILLVEDSRVCSEAVRLMAMRCGARLRRADCVKSARKHLSAYRPDLIMLDLGLPDESGLHLIKELVGGSVKPPAILAMSGEVNENVRQSALAAGAAGFLAKPVGNLEHFRRVVRATLNGEDRVPGFAPQLANTGPKPDEQALFDDLGHVRDILEEALPNADTGRLRYCAQFVSSVAQTAQDPELMDGAKTFFQQVNTGGSGQRSGQSMLDMLRTKLGKEGQADRVA